ncbi:carboxy terminal-processing peptidase [Pelagibaculum spongiae]|uniref:Tail-specific protease n=1 Tax=Pelagibaculum spongiae TaxID=2080658 RepID=A0A2V1GXT9_9GAMM|nr:carboxy terminal-processing peptidase [Pelagibaculum spongiae]PVZ70453.1 tail-specific protease [Pelagibaculum spongiae]
MIKRSLLLAAVIFSSLPVLSQAKPLDIDDWVSDLKPNQRYSQSSREVLQLLRRNHFVNFDLDDKLSQQAFDAYIKSLDGSRSYFHQNDIKQLSAWRSELDNQLSRGKLEPAFEIFNRYRRRVAERLIFSIDLLENQFDKIDFKKDESLVIDRSEAPWVANKSELQDIWRKLIKNDILSLKLSGKKNSEIPELLTKRYKNQLKNNKQYRSDDVFGTFINAVTQSVDPHTSYMSPRQSEQFDISMSRSLEGIGAVLQKDNEFTKVIRLVTGGPADKAGELKPGDKIIAVGQGNDGKLIDVIGWRLDDVVQLIRGKRNTIVSLQVTGSDTTQPPKQINITRKKVELADQIAKKKIITVTGDDNQQYKIGVIDVPTFYHDFEAYRKGDPNYRSTTRDVRRLLNELKKEKVDGLIVDLRNNGGGSLNEANSLTGLFIPKGPTVQIKTENGRVEQLQDNDRNEIAWRNGMAVLVNRLSASASEIFAGAIQDYNRGLIIGGQTFGKGTVQRLEPLKSGTLGRLKLTNAKFYRISGDSTQHRGVLPDIAFPSLFDKTEVGESSLPYALPWDRINHLYYIKQPPLKPLYSLLNKKHESRVNDDPDFQYVVNFIEYDHKQRNRKVLSLNESQRQTESDSRTDFQLELENTRRSALGLKTLKTIDDIDKDDDRDPYLKETGNILVDMIILQRQQFAATNS